MDLHPMIQALIVALVPFITTLSGLVLYIKRRFRVSDEERKMYIKLIMGLAHSKIVQLGITYMERGWITKDEYDDLQRYLFTPYHELGGNGTVERIMRAVERLPFKEEQRSLLEQAFQDIPIRRTDPTGFAQIDDEFERYPYQGEERRERKRPSAQ